MLVENLKNLFTFVGGIGMFLYGMHILSSGMQKAYGGKTRNILKALTANPFMGVLVGALVTILVNSSAATTVMVIGFVNANLITLNEAVGVIMGANIGTTFTAWLVALMGLGKNSVLFNPNFYAPLVLGIAVFVVMFSKKEKVKTATQVIIGLCFLFMGLSFMSEGITPYSDNPFLIDLFKTLGAYPFLALLLGIIVTALMQSSTAAMTILQTLVLTSSVTRIAAVFMILGQNIGTCVTAIISSLSSGKNAKKTAAMHLLFNVIGALICIILTSVLFPLLKDFLYTDINILEISIFHTCFNVCNTIILFPFINQLVSLVNFLFKNDSVNANNLSFSDKLKLRLDLRTLEEKLVAYDMAWQVVSTFARFTLENLKLSVKILLTHNGEVNSEDVEKVYNDEEEIDKSNFALSEYLAKLNTKSLSDIQHSRVEDLLNMCTDIERVGDHSENLIEIKEDFIENGLTFSDEAHFELVNISSKAIESFEKAIECIEASGRSDEKRLISEVVSLETEVDNLRDQYKLNHLKRLTNNICNSMSGAVFYEILSNLERVSDHARNLSDYLAKASYER